MTERRHHPKRSLLAAAWTLLWFGTVLAVNPRDSLSRIGVLLWAAGFALQAGIVARWWMKRLPVRV